MLPRLNLLDLEITMGLGEFRQEGMLGSFIFFKVTAQFPISSHQMYLMDFDVLKQTKSNCLPFFIP